MKKLLPLITQSLLFFSFLGILAFGYLLPGIRGTYFFNPVVLAFLALASIGMFFISLKYQNWYHYLFIPLPLFIVFGNMFRIMHWSYGKELVWTGLAGGIFLFVLFKALEILQDNQSEKASRRSKDEAGIDPDPK